jgi:bifunctional DNase/RNase
MSRAAAAVGIGVWILVLAFHGCSKTIPDPDQNGHDVQVRVDRVALDPHGVPVVVLAEKDGPRRLPIWIGTAEARSIALEIEERSSPRPNTHDLASDLIERLDGEVIHVVVTGLREGTYYATLTLRVNGKLVEVDSRPSDGIAIALRTGATIYVRDSLFESTPDAPEDGIEAPDPDRPERSI